MKKLILISLVLISTAHAKIHLVNKVIYGDDNRVEIDQYSDSSYIKKANAIAARIPVKDLKPISSSYFSFPDTPIQDIRRLCENIPFNEQPAPADCTGFLTGPKTLVTAGHCMRSAMDCERNNWVFGFKSNVSTFESSQIYSCKKIIAQKMVTTDYENVDYAVIELDREVEGATPLAFRKEGEISKDTPLLVIGHPSGLPMKAADGAVVKTEGNPALVEKLARRPYFFAANLDTFGGNSGSPVFNLNTGLVEGILVKGRDDYKFDPNYMCYRLNKVEDNNGEDYELVMKIRNVPGL
ncbi:MAG: trypsin-like peptidase domain-containing protein [Rhizobacter sp.]|nr:trypsin-like peptidase domain-containing protein [Bacteriovorax sp.]